MWPFKNPHAAEEPARWAEDIKALTLENKLLKERNQQLLAAITYIRDVSDDLLDQQGDD
jgi:hypothetical protein